MDYNEEEIQFYEHGPDCGPDDLEDVPGHPELVWCDTCQGYFERETKKPLPVMDKRFV